MADLVTEVINKGIYNVVNGENIPQEAASDALGWITTDDAIELARGRVLHGLEKSYKSNQIQTQCNKSIPFGEDDQSGKYYKIAQQFGTLAEPDNATGDDLIQKCDGVILYKRPDTGTLLDTATITISIQADSSNNPSGTDLTSKTYTKQQWANIGTGFFQAIFSSQYELDRDAEYWIVVTTTNTDSSNHPNLGYRDTNIFADGILKFNSTATGWQTEIGDLAFHVLEESIVSGGISGHHVAYKVDGTPVHFKKAGTRIQYYDDNAESYIDIFGGLTATKDVSFADHTSLSGNSLFIGGQDGLWKISVANPQDYADVYVEANNFKGKILIDRSRMLLWDRAEDRTGLYGSKIGPQDGTVYTTVSSEAIGSSGDTTYSGVLAFKSGGSTRTCFGVTFTATYADGTELFTDDYSGNLTGDKGGTGTINYMTGLYEITFANTTTGAVTADYQWEDSTDGGIADFQKSSPRQAAEGFIFRQDKGGDAILNVFVQEGKYISIKERSSYELTLGDDDKTATNIPFRESIGMPNWKAGVSATDGIIFMNTANPEQPQLTILQRISTASILEPVSIGEQFAYYDYYWDKCWMEAYGDYIVFTGRTKNSDTNNRLFVFNPRLVSMDVIPYAVNTLQKASGVLYGGSSVNHSVSKIFNGFDDDGSSVENYWIGRDELFQSGFLKKIRRLRFNGLIGKDQSIKVYISYDNGSFEQVGTILGDGSYVDQTTTHAIGTAGIGTSTVGGGGAETASPFQIEMKLTRKPKFRTRKLKFEAQNIGYASIDKIVDVDIIEYENRLPSKYRLKQNVSLDGESVDQ